MISRIRTGMAKRKTDGGATAVEYVLLVAAIALIIIAAAFSLGKLLNNKLSTASTCISSSGNGTC